MRGIPSVLWLIAAVLALLWLVVSSNVPPSPQLLFYDSFNTTLEGQPDPAWRLPQSASYKAARWIVSDQESYTIEKAPLGQPLLSFTGSQKWRDYRLEIDVSWASARLDNLVAILLRVQDEANMIGLFYQPGQPVLFKIKREGQWQEASDQQSLLLQAPLNSRAHLTLTVRGDRYRAYLGDQLMASATISDFSSGYIGLRTALADFNGTPVAAQFDNVRVMELSP